MKNVLVLVDTRNLQHRVAMAYNGGKLDFTKFVNTAIGEDVAFSMCAYGSPATSEKNSKFRAMLKAQGFNVRFKDPVSRMSKEDPDKLEDYYIPNECDICVDALVLCRTGKVDRVVIGSNNLQFIPLIKELKHQGIRVEIIACRVQRILRDVADAVTEIDESMLFIDENKV